MARVVVVVGSRRADRQKKMPVLRT